MNFNFSSRLSYIAWTAEWKTGYRALAQESREAKHALKKAQRAGSSAEQEFAAVRKNKLRANDMLAERVASKAEAQRQYLATIARKAPTAVS